MRSTNFSIISFFFSVTLTFWTRLNDSHRAFFFLCGFCQIRKYAPRRKMIIASCFDKNKDIFGRFLINMIMEIFHEMKDSSPSSQNENIAEHKMKWMQCAVCNLFVWMRVYFLFEFDIMCLCWWRMPTVAVDKSDWYAWQTDRKMKGTSKNVWNEFVLKRISLIFVLFSFFFLLHETNYQ